MGKARNAGQLRKKRISTRLSARRLTPSQ